MPSICVYCGSGTGSGNGYTEAARQLGYILAERQIQLIYGGASIGLMGVIADAVLEKGGRVTGVIPEKILNLEIAHSEITELKVVKSMHQRKALMEELSDGFIALPGGFGTLDELFEIMTWSQLGYHNKPCGLLNADGYFDELGRFLDKAINSGFISQQHRARLKVNDKPDVLLKDMFG